MARKQGPNPPSTKELYWRDVVQLWHRSGQSVRVFCAEHRLSEPSFYAWRRIINSRDQPTPDDRRDTPDSHPSRPAFVPVRVTPEATRTTPPPSTTGSLELVIGSSRVVRVSPGFDANTLRQLLAVLEESC